MTENEMKTCIAYAAILLVRKLKEHVAEYPALANLSMIEHADFSVKVTELMHKTACDTRDEIKKFIQ